MRKDIKQIAQYITTKAVNELDVDVAKYYADAGIDEQARAEISFFVLTTVGKADLRING